jgi:hypothetical protein
MTDEKKDTPDEDIPEHSKPEEKERLKDFTKDEIPPGSSWPSGNAWANCLSKLTAAK